MTVKRIEVFGEAPSDALIAALERTGTPYKLLLGTVYFRLVQGSDAYHEILPLVGEKERVSLAEYSESERKKAAWLEIAPRLQAVSLLNLKGACDYTCCYTGADGLEHAHHCEQIAPYEIANEIPWTPKRHFSAPDHGGSDVFASKKVKELVENTGLKGCAFFPVINQKTGLYCSDTFQLKAQKVIPLDAISFGHGETVSVCPLCGKKQFLLKNTYQFHLHFHLMPSSADILRTPALFHDGQAESVLLISQRFYRVLKEAELHFGLRFTPTICI